MGEDDASGRRLQDSGDYHIMEGVQVAPAALYDDHRAIIQVGHALAHFFTLLDYVHSQFFTGENDGLESVGQFIHIQDLDALKLGNAVEVVIGGEDGRFHLPGQLD